MRALKTLTVAMGLLIVLGTTILVATIIRRANVGISGPPTAATLDEPAGTRIAGIASAGDRLAVSLQGGGADRIVLIDPRTGHIVGRIALAP